MCSLHNFYFIAFHSNEHDILHLKYKPFTIYFFVCVTSFTARNTVIVKLPCMSVRTWWDASLRCAMTILLFKPWAGAVRRFLLWKSTMERKSSSILPQYKLCLYYSLCTQTYLNYNMFFLISRQMGGLPVSRLPWIPVYLWERQTSGRIQEL